MTTLATATTTRPALFVDDEARHDRRHRATTASPTNWITPHQARDAFAYQSRLWVSASGRPLSTPIVVTVRRSAEEDEVTVADEANGIFGVGGTLDAARDDFYLALLEYRDVLARQDELSAPLRDLLAKLASLA